MPVEMGKLIELAIAVITGGGVTELIRAIRSRRMDRVDSSVTLNDSTLKWAQDLQRDADDARAGERRAWDELRTARTEMRREMDAIFTELHKHRQLAEILTYRFRVLVSAIMSPNASVESLRELAQDPNFSGYSENGGPYGQDR